MTISEEEFLINFSQI